jgi:4-hydroxy-tetrahydrodipicolinate synthase
MGGDEGGVMKRCGMSGRRRFLRTLGGGAAALALSQHVSRAAVTSRKKIAGVFPIGFSPFTEENKLDLEGLASQVKFCNRGGVHGFVWPQLASAWSTLSEKERMDGIEAILADRAGKTVLVIGVQAPDMPAIERYVKKAEKLGADAIISLPPSGVNDEKALLEFYRRVGALSELPLFAQATGSMSVDLLIEMFRAIPTFRQVKDEAGEPLKRVAELRRRTDDQLKVFSGMGVQTMVTEMELGFSGHCPYTNLADIYSAAYDLWQNGQRREAFDMFGRIQALATMMPVNTMDIMIARGVLKPGTKARTAPPVPDAPPAAAGRRAAPKLSHEEIREALKTYLGPYLKA